jgi:hypothetical protein
MPEYLNIQPSPISLIESLREIGYSMETTADISQAMGPGYNYRKPG